MLAIVSFQSERSNNFISLIELVLKAKKNFLKNFLKLSNTKDYIEKRVTCRQTK